MRQKTSQAVQKVLTLVILVAIALAADAQKKPDFSGTWNLDKSQSEQNPEFSWAPGQLNITQDKNSISIERVSNWQDQEYRQTSNYTLDGKESINEGFQGEDIISIASWAGDGKSMSIVTDIEMQDGGTLTINSTYSKEKKNLKIVFATKGGPMGDTKEVWVYTRE